MVDHRMQVHRQEIAVDQAVALALLEVQQVTGVQGQVDKATLVVLVLQMD
jgi:hypothetical protein